MACELWEANGNYQTAFKNIINVTVVKGHISDLLQLNMTKVQKFLLIPHNDVETTPEWTMDGVILCFVWPLVSYSFTHTHRVVRFRA